MIRVQRARVHAAAIVFGHVGERGARVSREQYRAAVRSTSTGIVFAVLVRTRQVHHVRAGAGARRVERVRRRVDVVVVRALRLAVREAEGRQIDPRRLDHCRRRGAHGVVTPQARRVRDCRRGVVAAARADVHASLAAREQNEVELVSLGRRSAGADEPARRHDLMPGARIAVRVRPPDPAGEERRIHRVRVDRIDLHAARAARRARRRIQRHRIRGRGGAQRFGALVHELPAFTLILRAPDSEMRRARNERVGPAAACVRDATGGAAGCREHRPGIARLHRNRSDTAAEEVLRAERSAPALAAILRLVDPDAHLAAAAAGIRLARPGPDRLVIRIVWIERERRGALVLERRRDELPRRSLVLRRCGVVDRERVVGPPHATVRRGNPKRARVGFRFAIGRDHAVNGAAPEVFCSRGVHGAIAEQIREIVLAVGRAVRYPLARAK